MLQEVDDHVHIKTRLFDGCDHALNVVFPRFVFLLDQVDCVTDDSALHNPLYNGKRFEALIAARLHQAAIAEEIVDEIEYD